MATETAHADGEHQEHPHFLQHHFETPAQQFDAAKLGMWVFIATEILMFGGLFVAYLIYHAQEPELFKLAHHALDKKLGAVNTVVLLFSSLTAALAVRSAQLGKRNHTSAFLVVTLLCAAAFLVVKYFEYTHKIHAGLLPGRCFGHPGFTNCIGDAGLATQPLAVSVQEHGMLLQLPTRANMFFALYFMMTGLHGVHVLVGMSLLTWVLIKNIKGHFSPAYFTHVDLSALYWHLVDLVWIYLFPLLYLVS
jgi:cytochrome c oxidase subunit 3